MRVNLSYSVELEEVLAELSSLFAREKEKFIIADRVVMDTLKDKFTDDNLRDVFNALEEYKEALFNFDVKLGEIQQILKGYHDIVNAPLDNTQTEGEPETPEEASDVTSPEEVSNLELEAVDES
tara:strand:+ start:159 stop:530 length:372 start_codon:yes stop_codon:yes gene_type:complete